MIGTLRVFWRVLRRRQISMPETPGSIRRPAPLLGEHTREVLAEVGLPAEEIDRMVEAGAAITPQTQ